MTNNNNNSNWLPNAKTIVTWLGGGLISLVIFVVGGYASWITGQVAQVKTDNDANKASIVEVNAKLDLVLQEFGLHYEAKSSKK